MIPEAEKFNGWAAMLGFVAAFGAYATTGQIIPGIFQILFILQSSNKTILERNIGRPAMIAFVLLSGIYLTTGQLIPGVV